MSGDTKRNASDPKGFAPNGCPLTALGKEFDPFQGPYQQDPVQALAGARAEEPVFFSEKLGYYVVSRYDDVKDVFRDNITFSPSIALERITPTSDEAIKVLEGYDYAMNRTLVNEDEPAHMARRRALMHSFELSELKHHEAMVQKLTSECIDRFIDRGQADLMGEMFYEITLTVALHFLGVPEEDMATLRDYSVAHTLNTWGRPSKEEQIAVAEGVGKFWQYSGKVLDKMREDPTGPGWMQYSLRAQAAQPDVVTDSYLHSMMMAGLVAAHETTAYASANAMLKLLSNRSVWQEIVENPALIPSAIEECLRMSGSIIAWRRLATKDTVVGGMSIPEGSKLLIVMTSANHDPRHFENPDEIDLYRDNKTEHLSFGYGSHQCLGKNLARMEMRIFLEEFIRRLPHMQLMAEQKFDYLPNTSFRGPKKLLVEWDPSKNPEGPDPAIKQQRRHFEAGAPSKKDVERLVKVADVNREADGVISLTIADVNGRVLPRWSAGSHIDLIVGDEQSGLYERKYSLCGKADDASAYEIAILREDEGRGGSCYIHDQVTVGSRFKIRGPKNHFKLNEESNHYILIAGGIGITPIMAMADRLKKLGKDYIIHYAGHSRSTMSYIDRLQLDHKGKLALHISDEGTRIFLPEITKEAGTDKQVYACGPERLLSDLEALSADWPENTLHIEYFTATTSVLDPDKEHAFDVHLTDSDLILRVESDETVMDAMEKIGIDVPSDCREGLCGSCEVEVTDGAIDHRDKVLNPSERNQNDRMMTCCSRAKGAKISIRL